MKQNDTLDFIGEVPRFPVFSLTDSMLKNGIAVRSPNWLGDAVMTLPALVQLRKVIPTGKKLIVVTPPGLKKFYETLPMVDEVFALSKAHSSWTRAEVKQLRSYGVGCGLLFSNSPRDVLYFKLAGIRRLFGAAARGRSIFLTRSYAYPKRVSEGLNNFQHSAKYLSMVYALGASDWDGELPEFDLDIESMAPAVQDALKKDKLLIVAGGAAYGPAKRWPSENYAAVAKYWVEQGGYVVAIGTKAEEEIGDEIIAGLSPFSARNLAGSTNLIELMALLQNADMCVANDSGTMHLSAALGGDGIAIYGSTDPTATAPISSKWDIMFEQEPCAPCFSRECPLGTYACLTKISAEKVIDTIKKIY